MDRRPMVGEVGLGCTGVRGMKVRSSVKKLCEGCKVGFPLFSVSGEGGWLGELIIERVMLIFGG